MPEKIPACAGMTESGGQVGLQTRHWPVAQMQGLDPTYLGSECRPGFSPAEYWETTGQPG